MVQATLHRIRPHVRLCSLIAAITCVALTGCSTELESRSTSFFTQPLSGVTVDDGLRAEVPLPIRSAGMLTIATDEPYAPMEFVADGRLQGADVELGSAIAQTLGMAASFRQVDYTSITANVATDQSHLGISSIWTDEPTARLANMVSYYQANLGLVVNRAVKNAPTSLETLCGHSIAVEEGTDYIDLMVDYSSQCERDGKKPISIKATDVQPQATDDVLKGRVDVMAADSTVTNFQVALNPELISSIPSGTPLRNYGIAVGPHYGAQWAELIQRVVQHLIDNGTYASIMQRWHIPQGMVDHAQVQAARPISASK